MDVILTIICAIIHIAAKVFFEYEGAKLAQQYVLPGSTGARDNRRRTIFINTTFFNVNRNVSSESSEGVKNVYGPVICFICNSLIIVGGFTILCCVEISFVKNQSFWMMIAL